MRAGVVVAVLLLLGAGWWVVRHGEVPTVDPPATSAALDAALVQDLPASAESAARLPQRMAGSAQPVLPVPSVEVAPTSLAATTVPRVEIVGAVLDAAGAPIAGADVWYLPSGRVLQAAGFEVPIAIPFIGLGRQGPELLMDVPLAALAHTATDAEGRFAIAGSGESGSSSRDPYPAPGQPQLLVRAPGYAIGSRRAGDGLEPVELRLRQAALITGRVVDERDQPLPGVSVRVLDDFGFDPDHRELTQDPAVLLGELHSVISGPDGAFRLDGLCEQGTRPITQNLGERIGESPWLSQLDDVSVGHGVSLLWWRSGGSNTPTIRRLNPSRRHQLPRIAPGAPEQSL